MKVLFCTYPHVGVNQGGMYLQIQNTAKALRKLGVEVIFQDPWNNQFEDCDLCHFFSTHGAHFGLFDKAVALGIPCVWSNVFGIYDKGLARMRLEMELSRRVPGFLSNLKHAYGLSHKAKKLIALNETEANVLKKLFHVDDLKVEVIPNGVNPLMSQGDPRMFAEKYVLQPNYVLNVANVDANKNQLKLIEASIGQGWDLVLIGKMDDSAYTQECVEKAIGQSNIHLIGALPYASDLLISAYLGARTFCLPSYSEVQPLTLVEAAQGSCNLVVSDTYPLDHQLNDRAIKCQPSDVVSIRRAIKESQENANLKGSAVEGMPSWKDVAKRILEIYNNVL